MYSSELNLLSEFPSTNFLSLVMPFSKKAIASSREMTGSGAGAATKFLSLVMMPFCKNSHPSFSARHAMVWCP